MRYGLIFGSILLPVVVLNDVRLQAAITAWLGQDLDGFWQIATRLGYGAADIGFLVMVGLVGWWRGDGDLRARGFVGAAAVAGAGLLDQLVKNVVCRARPSAPEAGAFLVNFPCIPAKYAYASFPSGHATTAFATAVLLALWYPRWAGAWLGLAGLVGVSRIVLGSHFPSDVLAGALLGSAVGLTVHMYFPASRRRDEAARAESA